MPAHTQATLASGNFMGVINCLMQLRKVRGFLSCRVRYACPDGPGHRAGLGGLRTCQARLLKECKHPDLLERMYLLL